MSARPEVTCRYALDAARRPDLVVHVCVRGDGRPARPGIDPCVAEERARQLEDRAKSRR